MSAPRVSAAPIAYGIAQLGLNAVGALITVHLLFFYADGLGVATVTLSAALFVAQLWDLVLNPWIGHFSDATRWRSGRRRPFLVLGAVPLALVFALLLNPPAAITAGGDGAFVALTALLLVLYTARTVFEVPYSALLPELTQDYHERTRLASWRQLFGTLGDLLGAALPVLLVVQLAPREAFGGIGIGIAALIVVSAGVTVRGTREAPLPTAAAGPALEALRSTLRSRAFRIFLVAYGLAFLSTNVSVGLFRFVIKYVFAAGDSEVRFFGAYFAGAFLAVPAWIRLSGRIGKKPAFLAALVGNALVLPSIFVLPAGQPAAFLPVMALAGALLVGLWSLTGALIPDVIEWEELRTGVRREGAFFGVFGLVQKAGVGLALVGVSAGLTAIGYQRDAVQQPDTVFGLKLLFGGVPALGLSLAALVFSRFPITRESYAATLRELALRAPAAPPAANEAADGREVRP